MNVSKILNSFIVAVSLSFGVVNAVNTKDAVKTNADAINGQDLYNFNLDAEETSDFKVAVQQSTSTSTSHSFSLKFMSSINTISTALTTFDSKLKGVFITTDDANCPSDKSIEKLVKYDFDPLDPDFDVVEKDDNGDPIINEDGTYNFVPDKDGIVHDYKIKIPTYDGYVYRIEPSDKQESVIIPQYVTRQDRYRIRVTAIGSNVFKYRQEDNGVEIVEKDMLKRVNNIIVGPNVTTFNDNAFQHIASNPETLTINIIGDQEGRTYGENWSSNAIVNYNADYDSLGLSSTDVNSLKKVYSLSNETDEEGNTIYYDSYGYRIDESGNYLDEEGNIIAEKNPFEDDPLTNIGARVLSYTTPKDYSSKTMVFGDSNTHPMVLEYQVNLPDGNKETRYYEFPHGDEYNGVGTITGLSSTIIYVDFHINNGEKVDSDSLVIRNLFEQKDGVSELEPDLEKEFYNIPEKSYRNVLDFNEFVKVSSKSVRSYGEYTSFVMEVDKLDDIYAKVNPTSYAAYKNKIESGQIAIRYSFCNFQASTYRVTFVNKNNELVTKEVSFNDSAEKGLTLTFHLLQKNKGNQVTFLLKNKLIDEDFNAKSVRRLEYKAVSFKLDLMNTKKGTTQIITKSDVITRFGYLDILPSRDNEAKIFNANSFLLISGITYLVLYVVCAIAYYFYAKNKYKNDEFRRMNTKKYFKSAGIGFIGGAFFFYALLFIILRFAFFNVSVIVYNPLDTLVIVFGIIGIVLLGIFIKKMVTVFKQNKARRISIKLKLNEDVEDDGTK